MGMAAQITALAQSIALDVKGLLSAKRNTLKSFGAKGDGVTDDSNALRALLALGAGNCAYITPGTYIVRGSFTWPDGFSLIGEGMDTCVIKWAAENQATPVNMFESAGDISYLHIRDVGFIGNRAAQTTASTTGQELAAISLRAGSARNVNIERCLFRDFGISDNTAGAAIFVAPNTGSGLAIENIKIRDCRFQDIHNVPGVYVYGDSARVTSMRNIEVSDNTFTQTVSARQNAIYIIGPNSTNLAYNIASNDNQFYLTGTIDTCVEHNYTANFEASRNQIFVNGSASCTGILIRDYCRYGNVADNTLYNMGTGCTATAGISVSPINASALMQDINVVDNTIYGWALGTSATGFAIQLIRLTRYLVKGNRIVGPTAASRVQAAITLSGANLGRITENFFQQVNYALTFGGSVSVLSFEENNLQAVGDGAVGAIVDSVAGFGITNCVIRRNNWLNGSVGANLTPNFVSVSPAANTGNRIEENIIPTGIKQLNPSLVGLWEVVTEKPRSGTVIAGNAYKFDQGAIDMAAGAGYLIGANLDSTVPDCALGDIVIASASVDLQGCVITPYVSASNTVRIRVQNNTGGGVTIAAGTWRVLIVKASQMV